MYRGHSIGVVIPAFNEEKAIIATVQSIPDFVDKIFVIDDGSKDQTIATCASLGNHRCEILQHSQNRGVGAAIVTGYKHCLQQKVDIACVMAGDGQMDPKDLPGLLEPIVEHQVGYTKGNRFALKEVWRRMPKLRILGNILLSLVTKITSGYFRLFDSQCGYTCVSAQTLRTIDLDRVFPRYGYPNDLLARFHSQNIIVRDVPVRTLYGSQWKSGIRIWTVVYPISFVLLRSWVSRLQAESKHRRIRRSIANSDHRASRSKL